MSHAQLRQKTKQRTRSMLRSRALYESTALYLRIVDGKHESLEWYFEKDRLRIMLDERLVSIFEVCVRDQGNVCGGFTVYIDFARHSTEIQVDPEVDIELVQDQQLVHASTHETVDLIKRYIDALWEAAKSPSVQMFYVWDQAAYMTHGEDALLRKINKQANSVQEQARIDAEFKETQKYKFAQGYKEHESPDMGEIKNYLY